MLAASWKYIAVITLSFTHFPLIPFQHWRVWRDTTTETTCPWRNTRLKSMLPLWIRSNSTIKEWGRSYQIHLHRHHFGSHLSAGPEGDWLRETQQECFMIGCEHTQQGQQWLDESAQHVTGADVVPLRSCSTRLSLVCCIPKTLCDWPGMGALMRCNNTTES